MVSNKKVAIIGAGISGLSAAQELINHFDVDVYEKEMVAGGLIKCSRVNGSLFHQCGGHVFNSKRKDVLDWFWKYFNQDDFHKVERNSVIIMDDGKIIPYPIEDHLSYFDDYTQRQIIDDLLSVKGKQSCIDDFEQYLFQSFGEHLFNLYFKPYNEKIWGRRLNKIPISWLDGKMPNTSIPEIIFNNINRVEEKQFVHSSFWYENIDGSQFIADRLSKNLNVYYEHDINSIKYDSKKWHILDKEYDVVIFTGNVKSLPGMITGVEIGDEFNSLSELEYHGTTSVFCEIDKNPYSWIYLPCQEYKCHRIICTGNFANSNNQAERTTGTVEFTGPVLIDEIMSSLAKTPFHPMYIEHSFTEFSYPIQTINTRKIISDIKKRLNTYNFYLTGRFAEWEYYNMDVSIGASIDLCSKIINNK